MIIIVNACIKELRDLPEEIRGDLADALARLEEGITLSMPLSRPMPSLAKNVHEFRLRGSNGNFRILYAIQPNHKVVVLRAFKKKSQQTPFQEINLIRKRLKEVVA